MTTTTSDDAVGTTASRPRRRGRAALQWLTILVVALGLAVVLKTFVVEVYSIPSGSMEPTIHVGDRILVNKLSYDLHGVHRGDIVVFSRPPDDHDTAIDDLIKRVIGLPGETLRSGPNSEIFVDGHRISQPWLSASARADPGPPICSINNRTDCQGNVLHLGANQYFVMGDNRGDSDDARYFGPIAKKLIVGRAMVRVWPLDRLHWF